MNFGNFNFYLIAFQNILGLKLFKELWEFKIMVLLAKMEMMINLNFSMFNVGLGLGKVNAVLRREVLFWEHVDFFKWVV